MGPELHDFYRLALERLRLCRKFRDAAVAGSDDTAAVFAAIQVNVGQLDVAGVAMHVAIETEEEVMPPRARARIAHWWDQADAAYADATAACVAAGIAY